MYSGQSQNLNIDECKDENLRHIICDFSSPLFFSFVLIQSLLVLQRKASICLKSLPKYLERHAKSKHFPVCLAVIEFKAKGGRFVDGGITGGGRFSRFWDS